MSIEEEAIRAEAAAAAAEEAARESINEEMRAAAAPENPGFNIDLSFLKARTGPGPIEDYIDHPFNPSGSPGIAQILRGCTGLAGDLDLAIIDIAIGAFNFSRERKRAAAEKVDHETVNTMQQ